MLGMSPLIRLRRSIKFRLTLVSGNPTLPRVPVSHFLRASAAPRIELNSLPEILSVTSVL